MPQQLDWVGQEVGQKRRHVKDTKPAVAEAKAVALLELGELINKIPPRLKTGGSVNEVREYRSARDAAAKLAANTRASVSERNSAINNMRRFFS